MGFALIIAGAALTCDQADEGTTGTEAQVPADTVLERADSLYAAGAFAEAREIWRSELDRARMDGDSTTAALLLTSLGLAARQLGDYSESRARGEEALALKIRLGLGGELFRSYNALGLLAWNEGRLEEAARMFSQASRAAADVGDSLGVAKAASNMAQVHNDLGEPELARAGFEHLREVSRSMDDTTSWGRSLINLAMLDIRNGDPLPAIASLEEARRLARATEDAEAEENALGQLATAYVLLGEPQRAFAALDSALALAESHGLQRQAAEDVKLLGDLHAAAGDHRSALDHFGRAGALSEGLGLVEEAGNLLRAEAESFRVLGYSDTALVRARRAADIHRDAGYREAELQDLLLLAQISADQGSIADATALVERAQARAVDIGTPMARAQAALGSARVWDRSGDPEAVLRALASATDEMDRLGESDRWEPDALRARAYARLDRLEAAEAAGRRSMDLVEKIRAAYGSEALRTALVSSRAEVYGDLVLVLLRQGRTPEAFEVADAARGRALLDHLGAARSELAAETGAAGQLLRAGDLVRRIDELMARLETLGGQLPRDRSSEATELGDSLQARLTEARSEYEELLSRLAQVPEKALLGNPSTRLGEVQESLRPGELLVEYMVFPDRLDVFGVTPAGLTHVSTAVSVEALAAQVRLAIDLASRATDGTTGEPTLKALYETLVTPLAEAGALDGATRLIVVPHGPLVYLPFAALVDAEGAPLLARYSLLFLPSAAALPVLRADVSAKPGPPSMAGLVLAPLPDALPGTRSEAEDVRSALGLGRDGMLVGEGASEGALRQGLATSEIVHVATHGVMNPLNPMFTRLDLSPRDPGPTEDDGRLEVREILALDVAARLVFLSGCETGRAGAWATGFERHEDYATLAHAFLYAGARNVVATLWRVSDDGAAVLAARFYEALRDRDPVDALSVAQRAMLSDPRYRAPYFWAAYQISGSGGM